MTLVVFNYSFASESPREMDVPIPSGPLALFYETCFFLNVHPLLNTTGPVVMSSTGMWGVKFYFFRL